MFIDTDILYAYFTPEDWLYEDAKRVVKRVKSGEIKAEISPIVILELEILVKRRDEKEAKKILDRIKNISKLKIIDVDIIVAEKAFEYQKKFGLGVFDSFHAANCFFTDKKILSTDRIYDKVKKIKRLDPRKV